MLVYIYVYIHISYMFRQLNGTYAYLYTYIIYMIFVNGIPASARGPDDPDLARFSGPNKIAQTFAR